MIQFVHVCKTHKDTQVPEALNFTAESLKLFIRMGAANAGASMCGFDCLPALKAGYMTEGICRSDKKKSPPGGLERRI